VKILNPTGTRLRPLSRPVRSQSVRYYVTHEQIGAGKKYSSLFKYHEKPFKKSVGNNNNNNNNNNHNNNNNNN
jgi:hypothetical protein